MNFYPPCLIVDAYFGIFHVQPDLSDRESADFPAYWNSGFSFVLYTYIEFYCLAISYQSDSFSRA